jgi:hypothetical protein
MGWCSAYRHSADVGIPWVGMEGRPGHGVEVP